ncbi:hypothetical protein KKF61_02350 [Patescibacteria group bacterium]|nr:hypothetical protein [Patescibacteria group bacterium]
MQSIFPVALFFAFAAVAIIIWMFAKKQGFKVLAALSMTIAFIFAVAYGERSGFINQKLMWLFGYETQFAETSSWGPALVAVVIAIIVAWVLRLLIGWISKSSKAQGRVSPYLGSLLALLIVLYASAWTGSYLANNKNITPGTKFAHLITAGMLELVDIGQDVLKEAETETRGSGQ